MAVTITEYDQFKDILLNGLDWDTDVLKIALFTGSHTPAITDTSYDDLTNECTGTGQGNFGRRRIGNGGNVGRGDNSCALCCAVHHHNPRRCYKSSAVSLRFRQRISPECYPVVV